MMIISAIRTALGALDVAAKVKAAATVAAVSSALVFGGYVWGRIEGAAIARASAERANAAVRERDIAFAQDAADFNRVQIAETVSAENHNEALTHELLAPRDDDRDPAFDADWMRGLAKLK